MPTLPSAGAWFGTSRGVDHLVVPSYYAGGDARTPPRAVCRRVGILMQPGMPDLGQILLQAQQMQAEMERAQSSLAQAEVTGTASGGLVTAVVNGSGDLLRIRIDPTVVDPTDVETLEDLVIAAVHDARRTAEELASNAMGSVASALDLSSMGLPGLNFPGFGAQQELEQDFEDLDDDDLDDEDSEDDDSADDDDETVFADAAAIDAEIIDEEAELAEQDDPPAAPGPGRI